MDKTELRQKIQNLSLEANSRNGTISDLKLYIEEQKETIHKIHEENALLTDALKNSGGEFDRTNRKN
jgi:hypothetical protein